LISKCPSEADTVLRDTASRAGFHIMTATAVTPTRTPCKEVGMLTGHSVTAWIGQLKAGQDEALGRLHQRYWPLLVATARGKLAGGVPRGGDEEDVAQEAFWSFYRSVRNGVVPQLNNRRDLLALLTHIVACKAVNQIKHDGVQKRGGGRVVGEAALDGPGSLAGLDQVAEGAVSPAEQAALTDCYHFYLRRLPEALRPVAELHLAGLTNKEIGRELGCAERTVERKLALLKEKWRAWAAENVSADG
jgi:RNA polymerase sigma factor (sigma-70 family)